MPSPLRNKIVWLHHIYNDAEYKDRLKKKKTLACIKGFTEQDIRSAIKLLKLRIKNDKELTMLTTNVTESKEVENIMKHYANRIYNEFEKQIEQVFGY